MASYQPASMASIARRPSAELGRKGAETRRRLMAAAAGLLQGMSPVALTAAAIAREAGTSSATFYVYFDDIGDIVRALASDASDDLGAVVAVLHRWRAGLPARNGAAQFIRAFRDHYNDHRAILSIRNMEADRGDTRFMVMRTGAARPVLEQLADMIRQGHADGGPLSVSDAMGRAIVIYAAIERLAATEGLYPVDPSERSLPDADDIARAEIAMLAELVAPGG